jgi:hypothetical protein
MPLKLAAQLVFSKVYQKRILGSEDTLDSIASTIAVLAPIYECGVKSHEPVRALSTLELEGGMFKGAAERLEFIDGRKPRHSLAVAVDDVSATIDALMGASQ